MNDLHAIVEARVVGGHRLFLRFDDGLAGELDFGQFLRFRGVFEPMRAPATFAGVRVIPELGTIAWAKGADRSRCAA